MKCPHCGNEIVSVLINEFNYDGSDSMVERFFNEVDYDTCVIETDRNWVGYELSEEEMFDSIKCPHCHKFPFDNEIQLQEVVRVICFKKSNEEVITDG